MARNLFAAALMGGAAGFAQGRAQEIQAQEDFQRRLALQENSQENMLERMSARGGVGGGAGGGGSRTAKIEAPFDPGEAQRKVLYAGGDVTDADIRATMSNVPERMAAGYSEAPVLDPRDAQAKVVYGPDGKRLAEGETPYMEIDRSSPLVQRKIEELSRLRKMAAGFEAKDYQTYQETDLIDKASRGDRGAAEGVLLSKGKDPRETEARAEAQEAKAAKDNRTDPNLRRAGGGGGGGSVKLPDPTKSLTQNRLLIKDLVSSAAKALESANSTNRAERQKAYDDALRWQRDFFAKYGPNAGDSNAAAAPAAPASAAGGGQKTFKHLWGG